MKNDPHEWLTLAQTAEFLGVHPNTVRLWSDKGQIPVHRTEGRHRRYRRCEIELWAQATRQAIPGEPSDVVGLALKQMRFQIREARLESEAWYRKLDEDARFQYRQSGRALVQGLASFIASEGKDAAAETRSLGYEYASRGRRYDLSHVDAVRAFLFFRNLVLEAMMDVYREANIPAGAAWQAMLVKFYTFTDEILLSLLETYQSFESKGLSGYV
ncbi:MAG: helix-turn-helix domain-containing protein [Chloroflexota bacterium]